MHITTQVRGGDFNFFFCHEMLPLALSKSGRMRLGNRSDFAKCIQLSEAKSTKPEVNAAVLEQSLGRPHFHPFTGCDQTSYFSEVSKLGRFI